MTPKDQARRMAEEDEAFEHWYAKECPIKHSINVRLAAKHAWDTAIAAALVKLTHGQEPVAYLETITGQVRLPDEEHRIRFPKAYVPLYTHPIHSQQEERVRELEKVLHTTRAALTNQRRSHHYCEDSWYSCPKHEDGCANSAEGEDCNCGADDANREIDEALTAIDTARNKEQGK